MQFMAPEMFGERPYGPEVDIYAFGLCVLEMLTLEYPFSECLSYIDLRRKIRAVCFIPYVLFFF